MRNKLVRFWFFEPWELEQQQAWLSDMAAQGWHLQRLGVLAIFVKGTPAEVRYRCDVADDNEEKLSLYESAGWEYVGRRNEVQVFRAPVDATIPEIYTEGVEQAHTLRLLKRRLLVSIVPPLLLLAAITLGVTYSSNFIVSMLLGIGSSALSLIASFVVLYSLIVSVSGLVHLARLRRRLLHAGRLHSVSYQQLLRRRSLVTPVFFVLAVAALVGMIHYRHQGPSFPPIPEGSLGVVRLADFLEQVGYDEFYPSRAGDIVRERAGGDVFNYYREGRSLLVPVQKVLNEMYDVPLAARPGYSPILLVRRYETRGTAVARLLATHLAAAESRELFRLTNLEAGSLPGVDGYWQRSEGDSHAFIFWQDNVVINVFYNGIEPPEQLLELFLGELIGGF